MNLNKTERNGVVFEEEKKVEFNNKNSKLYVIYSILALLVVLLLAYFFNIYPGGSAFETDNDQVVIEKGILKKETFNFTVTTKNELKIALLKFYINEMKMKWYLYSIHLTAITIFLIGFIRSKYGKTITLSIFITLLILMSVSFIFDTNQIEGLISSLK